MLQGKGKECVAPVSIRQVRGCVVSRSLLGTWGQPEVCKLAEERENGASKSIYSLTASEGCRWVELEWCNILTHRSVYNQSVSSKRQQ